MLLFADGFEHYGTDETNLLDGVYANSNGSVLTTTQARTGSYSLATEGSNLAYLVRWVLPTNSFIIGVGFGLYMPALPTSVPNGHITLLDNTATEIATLVYGTDGSIFLNKGGRNGTTLGVSDIGLTAAAWHHVEFKAIVDDIVGSVEIRINEKVVMKLENLDLGSNQIASVAFMRFGASYHIDDLIIWDDTGDYNNDFIGPARVLTVFPNGDASPSEWTPNGATSAYECVDEASPDDDITYIGASDAGEEVVFTLPTLPPEIIELQGIYVPIRSKLSDAGIGKIKPAVIVNGVRSDGEEQTLTSAYTYRGQVFEENPDTGAAFTPDEFATILLAINKTL